LVAAFACDGASRIGPVRAAMTAPRPARMPETVFEVNRFTATLWVIFGCAAIIQGAATAVYFAHLAEGLDTIVKAMLIVCGGALVFFGQYFAREAWRRLRELRPAIVIGPAGLHDRELTARPVPWSAISGVTIRFASRGGRFVMMEIAPDAAAAAALTFGAQIGAPVNRALGYPPYRIHMLGVKADPDGLAAAMAPYIEVA